MQKIINLKFDPSDNTEGSFPSSSWKKISIQTKSFFKSPYFDVKWFILMTSTRIVI